MEVSAHTSAAQHISDTNALHLHIKDELVDNEGLLGDEDDEEDSYKPRPQLPKPFVVMRTLAHLMRDLESGIIDVDPEYQREVVWTADRMTGLINSLMEIFYIPPIILNKKTQAAPDSSRPQVTLVCVDGKQRLSSVRAFIKGMIPCHDHRGEKWWFCELPGSRRRKIISEETQKLFLSKEFVSFEFTDLSPDQEEDLFARVQMGVQLSLAEKMRASTGPWQELARLFVDDFPTVYSLMKDKARAKDFQLTLSCFSQILEVMHPAASNGIPILKTNYAALPKLLSNKGAVDDGIKSHLASVWNTFKDLVDQDPHTFTNAEKYLTGVQTFAPVEMVAVAVLISMYSESRNNRLLLGDIRALRIALREHFTDLRLHSQVWKFIWDYLEDLEAIRGAVDGSTVNRRNLETPLRHGPAIAPVPNAQRKGLTPGTSPRLPLPPPKSVTVKREQGVSTISSEFRSPKRKRINHSLENIESSIITHPNGTVTSPHFLIENNAGSSQLSGNSSARQSPPYTALYTVPKPESQQQAQLTPTVPRSMADTSPFTALAPQQTKTPARLMQKSPMRTAPISSGTTISPSHNRTPGGKTTSQESSGVPAKRQASNVHALRMPARTPLPTPAQVRQSRVAELNNYRAPTTLMNASAPIISTSQHAPTSPMYPSDTSKVALLNARMPHTQHLNNDNPNLRTGTGAFAPSYTEKQWQGEVKSISPPMPQRVPPVATSPLSSSVTPSASTTPLSQSRSARKSRRSVPRPTPAQYDGAIDLTSDTELEQERQELLSSFKGKSVAGKRTEGSTAASVLTPAAPAKSLQRVPVIVQDLDTKGLSEGVNPYAKFR
ncbi:Nn.00g092950.m01.CDS01 [Neocucurbitaria sp. VM-36]